MIRHISLLLILGWMWTSTVSANPCEGTNKTFVPHADCTKYYTCVNGVAHEMNCPDEYPIFEPNGPICVPGDPNACIECPPEGVHRFPVPNSCEKFILCVNGVRSQNECRNGLQFDPITQQCNLPTVVGCVNVECSATDNPANPEFIPHPSDCQVYFICVAGVPIRQECPDGTAFDTKNKVCDKEENVTCPLAMVTFFNKLNKL